MKNLYLSDNTYKLQLYKAGWVTGKRLFGFSDINVIVEETNNGCLAVRKWKGNSARFILIPDIYSFYRQCLEILWGYGLTLEYGERNQMMALSEAAISLNLAFIGLRKTEIKKCQNRVGKLRRKVLEGLEGAKNVSKVNALEHLKIVDEGIDSLGRFNPGAIRAATLAGRSDLVKRMKEISSIMPRIAARLMVADITITLTEADLRKARHYLLAIHGYLESHPNLHKRAEERMVTRLTDIIQNIKAIKFYPFLTNCALAGYELNQALNHIRYGRLDEARSLIYRSYNSLLLKELQSELEDIILELSAMIYLDKDNVSSRKRIILRLKALTINFSKIDEKGFVNPCVSKVNELLASAFALLKNDGDLKKIKKDYLKKASIAISVF